MQRLSTGQRLAEFSEAVRNSSLKRLKIVPPGKENWRISPEAMSFADTANHLREADVWLFKKLENKDLPHMAGKPNAMNNISRDEYERLLDDLEKLGKRRAELLSNMSDDQFEESIYDDRFGTVTVWWVIVRGNLDHEAHHRGQIAAYLRVVK